MKKQILFLAMSLFAGMALAQEKSYYVEYYCADCDGPVENNYYEEILNDGNIPSPPATFVCPKENAEYIYSCEWDRPFAPVTRNAKYVFYQRKTKKTYSVEAVAEKNGEGSIDILGLINNGKVVYGTEVTFTAVAKKGYRFLKWTDGVLDATRSLKVKEDVLLTAVFEKVKKIALVYKVNTAGGA